MSETYPVIWKELRCNVCHMNVMPELYIPGSYTRKEISQFKKEHECDEEMLESYKKEEN